MKQGNFENEEFIRVGTTLYKLVNQPRLNGGYVKKRIVWNNETLRQDYGKDYLATVPKYDGFCTVPDHVDYRPVVDKFLNLYEPIGHRPQQGEFPVSGHWCAISSVNSMNWAWTIFNCSTCNPCRNCLSCCWYQKNATRARVHS